MLIHKLIPGRVIGVDVRKACSVLVDYRILTAESEIASVVHIIEFHNPILKILLRDMDIMLRENDKPQSVMRHL